MYNMNAVQQLEMNSVVTMFDEWRATTRGMGRIPVRLWQAAFSLESRYTIPEICREIEIPEARYRNARAAEVKNTPSTHSLDTPAFVMVHNPSLNFGVLPVSKPSE